MPKDSFKVFLSHAEEDYDLVFRIFDILFRLKASPYMHESYPDYRRDIPTGIRDVLRGCTMCVAFLTKDGINSQWVQQELGVAYAFERIIVPVIETGVEYKGFVQMVTKIPYEQGNPDLVIYDVIYAVRKYVVGHNEVLISLTCANNHKHDYSLPSTDAINTLLNRSPNWLNWLGLRRCLGYKCPMCGVDISVNPETLEIIKGTKGVR